MKYVRNFLQMQLFATTSFYNWNSVIVAKDGITRAGGPLQSNLSRVAPINKAKFKWCILYEAAIALVLLHFHTKL